MPRPAARSAAAFIASASATVFASGFSQSTCLPASSAAIAISACVSPGVTMSTTSMSSRAITSRQSVAVSAQPHLRAFAATPAASRPTTTVISGSRGRSKNRGATRQPWECAAPMKPWPIMATRSRSVNAVLLYQSGCGAGRPAIAGRTPRGYCSVLYSKARSMNWSTFSLVTTGASSTIRFGMPGVIRSPIVLLCAMRRASATPSAPCVDG